MLVSNKEIKRNIYPQTGVFSYIVNIQGDNITGESSFGFSGDNSIKNQSFSLKGGKIFYETNNEYIDSYFPNENVNISGNISENKHTMYVNGNLKILGEPKETGYYNYFYMNTTGVNSQLGVQILGQTPEYDYDVFDSYLSGQIIPIGLENKSSYPLKIFSGDFYNPTSNFSLSGVNNLTVGANQTENFYLTPNAFIPGGQLVPIRLYSNFGRIEFGFTASGQDLSNTTFYILFGPEQNLSFSDGDTNDYVVNLRNTSGMSLAMSLEYISGNTGDYYKDIQKIEPRTGNVSGLISGSGELKSTKTGVVSYFNPINSQTETGFGSGNLSKFVYATGNVNYEYSVELTGLSHGFISLVIPATGHRNVEYSGFIGYNGGWISAENLTGLGTGYIDSNIVVDNISGGIAKIYIPYTGEVTINLQSGDYTSQQKTSPLTFATGLIDKFYALTGFVFATGDKVSGKFRGDFGSNFEPGIYTFYKNYSGLASGTSNVSVNSFDPVLVEYKPVTTYGYISGTYYSEVSFATCNFEVPIVVPADRPDSLYVINEDGSSGSVSSAEFYLIEPLNKNEYILENTDNVNSRTNISRRGNTASGSGYANNVFREPGYRGVWSEKINDTYNTYTGLNDRIFNSIDGNPLLLLGDVLTGNFVVRGSYTGYENYHWEGRVDGNFSDYSTNIYAAKSDFSIVSGPSGILYRFPSSYSFDMNLKTGNYVFSIEKNDGVIGNIPLLSYPRDFNGYNNTTLNVPFVLTDKTNLDVTLTFSYEDNEAQNGVDYIPTTNTLTFFKGENGLKNLQITIPKGIGYNQERTFKINILSLDGGYIANKNAVVDDFIVVSLINPNQLVSTPDDFDSRYFCSTLSINTGSLLTNTGNFSLSGGSLDVSCGVETVAIERSCPNFLGDGVGFRGYNGYSFKDIIFREPVGSENPIYFNYTFNGLNDYVKLSSLDNSNLLVPIYQSSLSESFFSKNFYAPPKTKGLRVEVIGGYENTISERPYWNSKLSCETGIGSGEDRIYPYGVLCEECIQINSSGGYEKREYYVEFPRPILPSDDFLLTGLFIPYDVPDNFNIKSYAGGVASILYDSSVGANFESCDNYSLEFGVKMPTGTTSVSIYVDGTIALDRSTKWQLYAGCSEGCCSEERQETACASEYYKSCCPSGFIPDLTNCPTSYGGCIPMFCDEGEINTKTDIVSGSGRYYKPINVIEKPDCDAIGGGVNLKNRIRSGININASATHNCDQARFAIDGNNIRVGEVNLNNKGPMTTTATGSIFVTSGVAQQMLDNDQFMLTFDIICIPQYPPGFIWYDGCHDDVLYIEITDIVGQPIPDINGVTKVGNPTQIKFALSRKEGPQ